MGSWGEQFSTGSQDKTKIAFWRNDYRKCPICSNGNFNHKMISAGCRHNGDGYGTATYSCKDCSWSTSYEYDESDVPYYYETRKYKATIEEEEEEERNRPKPVEKEIKGYIKTKYVVLRKCVTDADLKLILEHDSYCSDEINKFIVENKCKSNV